MLFERLTVPRYIARGIVRNSRGWRMDKVIYGADTETCEGPPITFQFYSEDGGFECDDIVFLDHADDALDEVIYWCSKRRRHVEHVVYVHNLDFDEISFLWNRRQLLASTSGEFEFHHRRWHIHGVHGAPSFFRVTNGKDLTVTFVDSFSWIRSSLAHAAELFCPQLPKLERPSGLGVRKFTKSDTRFKRYAMRDAEIAYHMGRAIETIHREFDIAQCVSIADTAARIFRHKYVREPIPLPPATVIEASLFAYHGGKNGFVGKPGWYRGVTALDISSAYPHAMHSFPHFTQASAYREVRLGRVKRVPELGVYMVKGELAPCSWPVVFNHSFKPMQGCPVEGIWVTGYELNEALASGELRLSSASGYVYDVDREKARGDSPLHRFCSEFYGRKEVEKDRVKRTFYKLILNSLSGKFIQTRKKDHQDVMDEDNKYSCPAVQLVAGGLFHPFIAGLITGHTRARIHQLEHQYKAIHTSTDGIITRAAINPKMLPKGLGGLTIEAQGDALIMRNKLYVIYADQGTDPSAVFRDKFIIKHATHGFLGTIWDLERMIVAGRRSYVKTKPTRLKESIKRGKIPNKWETYRGTLKVGDLLVRA